jgi:hypothetical protein
MLRRRHDSASGRAHREPARIRAACFAVAVAATMCVLIGPAVGAAAAQPPVNNLAPEVVGNGVVGERLVCGAGSWSGVVSGFTYEWIREGNPVASGVAYTIRVADEGQSLWCIVTATGGGGSAEAESSNSVLVEGGKPGSAPRPITLPQVSGKPALGEPLMCSQGTWSGSPPPTFTYQWIRDRGPEQTVIESATTSTYVVSEADAGHSLSCKVTASNRAGSETASSSNALGVPGSKPTPKVLPRVLGLEPSEVGEALTCSPGTWSGAPAPSFSYRWLRDGSTIAWATASTYVVAEADQLHSLSCRVTASNSEGKAEATSSNSVAVRGAKPANTVAPEVGGTPEVGQTLRCEKGTWSGVPAPTFEYLWIRDQGLPGEEAISSARTATYPVVGADRGHSLACEVTATNSEGSASQSSRRVVVPANHGGEEPKNVVAPEASGAAALGATLTCSQGTWTGKPAPTLTYQWLRDGSPIPSATSSGYEVQEADEGHSLACEVTAVSDEGSASKTSNAIEIPGVAPQNLEPPQVAGSPAVGQQLICLRGRWSAAPKPAFAYQWLRDGTSIASATQATYTVTSEDRGKSIACTVTAQNSAGTVEATSPGVKVPGNAPEAHALPEVSGIPAVGNALTCSPGTWSGNPAPTYTFQWLLNGTAIASATATVFTVTTTDLGLDLACRVTATNHEGSGSATSKPVHVPGTKPENLTPPQVSGTPTVGQQLTCLRGTWTGKPPPMFTYQWLRDGTSLASATSSTYTVELADVGHELSCKVTATNGEGTGEATSGAVHAQATGGSARGTESSPLSGALTPTAAELVGSLRAQLARAQHHARISSLRKKGLYAFSVLASVPGTLNLVWYQVSAGSHHSASSRPLILALSSTAFATAGIKQVKLRLTSAGRRLIAQSSSLELTLKGQFVPAQGRPVAWLKTVTLHY